MDRAAWQLVISLSTAVISLSTVTGVLWNAIQINSVDSKVDELKGKVETIEEILKVHVNTPALHSMLPVPEASEERSAAR